MAGKKAEDPPLSAAFDRSVAASRRAIGRTKAQALTAIKTFDIAAKPCSTSADVVAFATELSAGRQPRPAVGADRAARGDEAIAHITAGPAFEMGDRVLVVENGLAPMDAKC
ncbi:hypothetical protein [Methylobacterium platani]|uniref:Uncharacterized protein n=2 Tax=Methylobacterium platani TaxID=427683 RepID=A0A179SCA2_9HYPH|nr:hypothetical protein [Methylobacterium platani]KMO19540.1 hypothetical protein SQ03_07730 [Methylobacterium platani JCM 14648]OAS24030.1 hypothetical protein A5481_14760 [Methylobacterium platani]